MLFRSFTAANFLAYAQNLRVVRAANTAVVVNATSGSEAIGIDNKDVYEQNYLAIPNSNTYGMFAARYPGLRGNTLKVSLWANSNSQLFSTWSYYDQFDSAPGTSNYVSGVNGANDEMHIVVIDRLGKFTGVANTVLEKFAYVSKASDAKNDDGSSNYYVNVINDRSQYIYIMNHAQAANGLSETTSWGRAASNLGYGQSSNEYTYNLANGNFAMATDGDLELGYDKFINPEEVDVSLVITGGHSKTIQQYVIDNVCEARKDCIAFISPTMANTVNNVGEETSDIIDYRNNLEIGRAHV